MKKKHKIIKIFCLVLLSFLSVFIYLKFNPESNLAKSEFAHLYSIFFDLNTFSITGNELDQNLRITWIVNSSGVDNELVIYENNRFNKKNIKINRFSHGENLFVVFFGESEINRIIQIKENNWSFYHYNFVVHDQIIELIINEM